MRLPPQLAQLMSHPAPGLLFDAHPDVGIPPRVLRTFHARFLSASRKHRAALTSLFSRAPEALKPWFDLYRATDGFAFCCLPEVPNNRVAAALALQSLNSWEPATRPFASGDRVWQLEGLEHVYRPGAFKVFATSPSEGTALTVMLENAPHAPAGSIYYISLDPIAPMDEPFAPTLTALLDRMASDPAKLLNDLGYCSAVAAPNGSMYGDPVSLYLPDVRGDPRLVR